MLDIGNIGEYMLCWGENFLLVGNFFFALGHECIPNTYLTGNFVHSLTRFGPKIW